jgi:hypothetical protein
LITYVLGEALGRARKCLINHTDVAGRDLMLFSPDGEQTINTNSNFRFAAKAASEPGQSPGHTEPPARGPRRLPTVC